MISDLENPDHLAEATLAYEFGKLAGGELKKRKSAFFLAGAAAFVVIVAGGAFMLFSGRSEKSSELAGKMETIKKEGLSPATRSAAEPGAPSDEGLVALRESFDGKAYQETVRLAEELLIREPGNAAAKDYLQKARAEITASEVAPLLQSGIASYAGGNYAQCVTDMEKVLKIDKDNKDAQKYLFQADTAQARPEISALIERHRVAEENKDLLTVLSHYGSPALADSLQAEYKLLFNGYDGIKSNISRVALNFSSRSSVTATYSHLLTAVYKKTGQRKIVFEGQKTWQLRRQGKDWKISAIQ
jgi:tetratricopeptide (TPR) repeat protein